MDMSRPDSAALDTYKNIPGPFSWNTYSHSLHPFFLRVLFILTYLHSSHTIPRH
jgi:hypothetical protein